ncbi:hypothetical protein [Clostridium vincentii]|uniref:Uncharacterized protein n=1 Tax=Clostridium vincentii TaxID=52704 RepID=A0A2T0B7A8_9CLOT|nr:hypothetical protein [Clostridium vincentii]PRR79779.1 hypothetical protein CLVI_32250 [Clostridium vincentii]
MDILQEIRKIMKPEYDYYNKCIVQDIIYNDNNYNAIYDIIGNQKDPNSYNQLNNNLDDVQGYMRYHCSELLEE